MVVKDYSLIDGNVNDDNNGNVLDRPLERHISINLATLSRRNDGAIAAIGAYEFDLDGDDSDGIVDSNYIYLPVDLRSAGRYSHIDGGVVSWWMRQDEARMALLEGYPLHIVDAMVRLKTFILYGENNPSEDMMQRAKEERQSDLSVKIWCEKQKDIPILEHAFNSCKIRMPWHFRNALDVRTSIYMAYGGFAELSKDLPLNPHPNHSGYDAWHQALSVQHCFAE